MNKSGSSVLLIWLIAFGGFVVLMVVFKDPLIYLLTVLIKLLGEMPRTT